MDEEKQKIDVSRLLSFAYRFLSYRARTQKEIQDYLQKKAEKYNFSPKVVSTVFFELTKQGYVNDENFIKLYISSRSHSKPKGKYALTVELQQKGIPRELIENYFLENRLDETTLARSAVAKRWPRLQTLSRLERTKKAAEFLRRRGFPYDVIKKTIEELELSE